jgi:adenosylcobinamide amidohydrolase
MSDAIESAVGDVVSQTVEVSKPTGAMAFATPLADSSLFHAARGERFFVVSLKQPHRVYSTSPINGGEVEHVRYLVNHQSMEAIGSAQMAKILSLNDADYHMEVARELGINGDEMVLMGTAVNMSHVAHQRLCFEDLCIDAFVTAGVKGNALRAGDATCWYETAEGNRKVEAHRNYAHNFKGTINTILLINQPLTAGAQAKAMMLSVEAKSAALSELAVPSKGSEHLATGTGTDQLVIATPQATSGQKPLISASGHLKLGELVGDAVRLATREALLWQNEMSAAQVASIEQALGRFGLDKVKLLKLMRSKLNDQGYQMARDNIDAIDGNARLAAAAFAYGALLDRFAYNTLPLNLQAEVLRDQAAHAAVAISGKPQLWTGFWAELDTLDRTPINLFAEAVALGWQAKWQDEYCT